MTISKYGFDFRGRVLRNENHNYLLIYLARAFNCWYRERKEFVSEGNKGFV
jgi:hypothetical protein